MQKAVGTGVKIALTLLMVFTLVVQLVFAPLAIGEVTRVHPQTGWIAAPAMVWAAVTIGCTQAILVAVWRLTTLASGEGIFTDAAFGWVRAMITAAGVMAALLGLAWLTLAALSWTPPLVMYGLLGGVLLAVTFLLVVVVMLGLLRRATALASELAQVV